MKETEEATREIWVRTSHTVARIIFREMWKTNHPESTEEELNEMWEATGEEYRASIRRALKILMKKGIIFSDQTSS